MPRKRSKQLQFFVSDKELEHIKSKVAESKLSQSDYLRRTALGKDIVVVDGIRELTLELKRIGNNLNQLTKLVHQTRLTDFNGEVELLRGEMKKAWHSLRQLIRVRGL